MTLTIDCVYEQGYIPDQEEVEYPIKEDLWNTESNIVRYTVKNNLHKQIFYEFRFLSANGEWMDDDRETETTWYLDADDEMTICMNNPDRLIGSTGRDSLTWAKTELYVWMMNDAALQNSLTFDVTFKVYDYTESYGEYINDNVYGVAHNNSIKEILDPTMKQYDAQIVMRDIND